MKNLTPDVVARLGSLEVKARTIVEGLLSGEHRGRRSGFSVDFAEHRAYTPGDDVRHIDWKIFGKRDRLYIRQFEEETRLKAWLLVDVSRSMYYQSDGSAMSKLEYANSLAAAIGWVICQQRDEIALVTFADQIENILLPRSGITGLREILSILETHESQATLESPAPTAETHPFQNNWEGLHAVAERITDRSVVFVLTDAFGEQEQLLRVLKHFHVKHCDVRLVQILDAAELDFPFDDNISFNDLETGESRTVMTRSIRASYLEELHRYLNNLKRDVKALHGNYHRIPTREPLDRSLLQILD